MPDQTLADMRALVGERVRVTLEWGNPEAVAAGRLVDIDHEGQATLDALDGQTFYAWPTLHVERVRLT